jgi:hypothetical protein
LSRQWRQPASDLDHILSERYPGERLADDFHERYLAARAALRRRTHTLR